MCQQLCRGLASATKPTLAFLGIRNDFRNGQNPDQWFTQSKLGKPVLHFAPPYGASNASLEKLALQAGYKYIWTTKKLSIQRSTSLTSLGRVRVGIKGTSAAQVKATILKAAKSAK